MAACVPPKVVSNKELGYLIPEEEIEKTIQSIGIREKRFAAKEVCASDLCFKAARQLMTDNEIDPESVDVLLFLSQTPDYKIPATSPILQQRLGLPTTTACLDLSLGCSGYVYALSAAYAYASMPGIRRVLLLVGETFSKIVSPWDKVNAPLYGDAGTATLVEKGNFLPACFVIGCLLCLLGGIFFSWYCLLPLLLLIFVFFIDSWRLNKRIKVAFLSIVAAFIQLFAYGIGFIHAVFAALILKRPVKGMFVRNFYK